MIDWLEAGLKVGLFFAGVILPIVGLTKLFQWIGPRKDLK